MRRTRTLVAVLTGLVLLASGCGGSGPNGTPSPTPTVSRAAAAIQGAHMIQVAIQSWAVDHGDRYPKVGLLNGNQVGEGLEGGWPENPWTGQPMVPGSGLGNFTYKLAADRKSAVLIVHGENGAALQRLTFGQ